MAISSALSTAILAGCFGNVKPGPTVGSMAGQAEPDPDKLVVQESARVAQNQALAVENYRKLLELQTPSEKRFEAIRRLADLQVQIGEVDPTFQQQQEQYADTQRLDSIELYQQLLTERPNDANNDRVLYQMARAYQNRGDDALAIDTLARLSREFPESQFAQDGVFRRAELLFGNGRFAEAQADYQAVIEQGPEGQFYELAQYKHGWSIFKQGRYREAVVAFLPILKRELPATVSTDHDAVIATLAERKRGLVNDVLRVTALSFAYEDGGQTLVEVLQAEGGTRFDELLFTDLGTLLIEKERYTDAARAYRQYVDYKPNTLDAPRFAAKGIDALETGGFADLAIGAKEEYVQLYDLDGSWWASRRSSTPPSTPPAAPLDESADTAAAAATTSTAGDAQFVRDAWQANLEDVARHYHAIAQNEANPRDVRLRGYERAGRYYRRYVDAFPRDDKAPEINILLAETLYDTSQWALAAQEFTRAAYDYGEHSGAADAAYSAIDSQRRHIETLPVEQRADATLAAIDTTVRYADSFPAHPQVAPALTRAAEDLYGLQQLERAAALATRVVEYAPPAPPTIRRSAWQIIGLARFDQERYADAEAAFSQVLPLVPPGDAQLRTDTVEQLASAIYKQGEIARDNGQPDEAVQLFLRVGEATPSASIRPTAEYDAAAVLIAQQDWTRAADVLLGFRERYAGHPLQGDVTRKLAAVYLESGEPLKAAGEFSRIARSLEEPTADRQAASLKAAQLYDENGALAAAGTAYGFYLAGFVVPFDDAIEIRQRLVEIYTELDRPSEANLWRREIVNANGAAGTNATDRSRILAARAGMVLAEDAHREFDRIRLTLPLQNSLRRKREALEAALAAYRNAAALGVAEVTTEATHKTGTLYRQLAADLMRSQRPSGLSDLEREQYDLLLEEEAFPIEEQAIDIFTRNAARADDGIYDEWVRASIEELAKLSPARFGKKERYEKPVNAIR